MVILAAQMDFIKERLSVFVRLDESIMMPDLPEA